MQGGHRLNGDQQSKSSHIQPFLIPLHVKKRTSAFLSSIFMDRESWGVDPEFYELAGTDVPLDNVGRNVEVVWVLGVHGNTVHQLIFVGELLVAELLLQVVHLIFIENSQPDCRFVRRCPFNSVFFVGRNVHKIAELKFPQYCSRLELKPRFILQNNDPVCSSWLYQKPSGETWPWETIRSIRMLAALSSVVRKLSGRFVGRSLNRS
jgi:hypothetical protein